MAHRAGRRDQLLRPVGRAVRAARMLAARRLATVVPGRVRGIPLAATLVVAAGVLVLATGPAGHDQNALAAMAAGPTAEQPRPSAPAVAASALDSLAGTAGIDPLDLVGKGVIVAALLYLTLRALRHLQAGPAAGSRRLQVMETRPLGPKASLHLVAVGERRLVVGLSPGGIVAIAELDAAELAEPAGAAEESPLALLDGNAPRTAGFTPTDLGTAVMSCRVAARRLLAGRAASPLDEVPVPVSRRGDDR